MSKRTALGETLPCALVFVGGACFCSCTFQRTCQPLMHLWYVILFEGVCSLIIILSDTNHVALFCGTAAERLIAVTPLFSCCAVSKRKKNKTLPLLFNSWMFVSLLSLFFYFVCWKTEIWYILAPSLYLKQQKQIHKMSYKCIFGIFLHS